MPIVFENFNLSPLSLVKARRIGNFLGNECNNAEIRATYAQLLLREHLNEKFIEAVKSPLGYNLLLKERLLSFILSYKSNDLYRTLEYVSSMSERERRKFKTHGYNVAMNYGSLEYPYFTLSVDFAIFIKQEVGNLKSFLNENKIENKALSEYQEDTLYGNDIFGTPYTRDGSNLRHYFEQVKYNMARQESYPESVRPTEDEEKINKKFYQMLEPLNTMGEDLNTYVGYLSAGINLPSINKACPEELILITAWINTFKNFEAFYLKKIEPIMDGYTF
jgi:hypothetical protein